MNVIILYGELNHLPVFPFRYGFEDSAYFILHLLAREYLASVLGRPDEVEFEIVEAMG